MAAARLLPQVQSSIFRTQPALLVQLSVSQWPGLPSPMTDRGPSPSATSEVQEMQDLSSEIAASDCSCYSCFNIQTSLLQERKRKPRKQNEHDVMFLELPWGTVMVVESDSPSPTHPKTEAEGREGILLG